MEKNKQDSIVDEGLYRKLQQHLDKCATGFPASKSGVEINILKHLFSYEEAQFALNLSPGFPEKLNKIYRRLKETGMRIGEFLGIDCKHLNVERRYVETEGKTGRNIYYFSKGLADHLTLYMKERELKQNNCEAFFLSVQGGRYTRQAINRYIRKTVTRVGIDKWISAHTFRKTINTLRKKMGCPREDH